ncbi:MAG TPA: triose-phosphate isomerase, partial [Hyphomicrobium sp.]|nr:triose-phosphate isomerase [Hyphomicrobium sp.]
MAGESVRPRPLVAGNWKMNGLRSAIAEAKAVADVLAARSAPLPADVLICPPATLVMVMSEILKGTPVAIGAQDCHTEVSGAHTGDLSAEILADA